jgi:hypothetical protein
MNKMEKTETKISEQKFRNALKHLVVGKKIWDFAVGESTGSIISFECGEKIANTNLKTQKVKPFVGELTFMVYCSWRIISNKKVIVNGNHANLATHLQKIEGMTLKNMTLVSGIYDLRLDFENNYRLEIFCDIASDSDWDYQWYIKKGNAFFCANTQGELVYDL